MYYELLGIGGTVPAFTRETEAIQYPWNCRSQFRLKRGITADKI